MTAFLDFVMANYNWILAAIIIILLAIIGRYADKTNFGQKSLNENKDNEKELNNNEEKKDGVQEITNVQNETIEGQNLNVDDIKTTDIDTNTSIQEQPQQVLNSNPVPSEEREEKLEEDFQKLDREFDEIIPKKGLMDNGLLDDIDSLSLDKTQKIDISDIPDLDDVELPEITKLKKDDDDIWKF